MLQSADALLVSSDILKSQGKKVREKHEKINEVPRWVYNILVYIQCYDGVMFQWCNGEMVMGEMVKWLYCDIV